MKVSSQFQAPEPDPDSERQSADEKCRRFAHPGVRCSKFCSRKRSLAMDDASKESRAGPKTSLTSRSIWKHCQLKGDKVRTSSQARGFVAQGKPERPREKEDVMVVLLQKRYC